MRRALLLTVFAAAGCSTPGGPYPSLQPRAAERIDPRVPVAGTVNDRPVSAALSARLQSLVAQARSGDAAFAPAAAEAERLAASAGAPRSDSWIAAQEALSGAIAARRATATALADIDALGGDALERQGGLSPNDESAIKAAAAEVAALDLRQAARIDAIQRRLGL